MANSTENSLNAPLHNPDFNPTYIYILWSNRVVAALDSKLPNGVCPVPRYTRTLPCEQMIARCRYTLSEYFAASLRTRYKS